MMTQDTWTEITADDKPARAQHTPGRWQVVNNTFYFEIRTCSEACEQIGDVCASKYWNNGSHAEANAKLIAAAPTMLAVLHQVSRHFAILAAHGTPVDVTLEDAVHEAIDDAGGY